MGEPSPYIFLSSPIPTTYYFTKWRGCEISEYPKVNFKKLLASYIIPYSELTSKIVSRFSFVNTYFSAASNFLPRVSTFLPRLMRIVFIFERKVRKLFEAGSSRSRNWGRSQLWSSSILSPIHIFVLYLIFFFKAPFFLIFLCADFYFVRALVSSSPLFRLPKRNIF